MSKAPLELIVVAERDFTRGCLLYWLRACCPEFEIVAGANLRDIYPEGRTGQPAAIILQAADCSHQGLNWIELQNKTKAKWYSSVLTLLIIDRFSVDLVQEMVSCGVIDGFIPTSDTTEVAAAALRLVIAGGRYMPPLVAIQRSTGSADPARPKPVALLDCLTSREHAVLELLKTGKPNKLIAYKLGMSLSTAKVHVHNIIRKLNVKNRTEAVVASSSPSVTSSDQFRNFVAGVDHLKFALPGTGGDTHAASGQPLHDAHARVNPRHTHNGTPMPPATALTDAR